MLALGVSYSGTPLYSTPCRSDIDVATLKNPQGRSQQFESLPTHLRDCRPQTQPESIRHAQRCRFETAPSSRSRNRRPRPCDLPYAAPQDGQLLAVHCADAGGVAEAQGECDAVEDRQQGHHHDWQVGVVGQLALVDGTLQGAGQGLFQALVGERLDPRLLGEGQAAFVGAQGLGRMPGAGAGLPGDEFAGHAGGRLELPRGLLEDVLHRRQAAFAARQGLLAVPGELHRPELAEVGEQVGLPGEVIEEGGLGDLDLFAQIAHVQLIERGTAQPVAQGAGEPQARLIELALPQGDPDPRGRLGGGGGGSGARIIGHRRRHGLVSERGLHL